MPIPLPDNRDRRAWQAAVWNAPEEELSGPQKLEFLRMLEIPCDPERDRFDPFRIVRDLLANRHLWRAARVVTGYPFDPNGAPPRNWHLYPDLLELFELGAGDWRPDVLYLLHDGARGEDLANFADNHWGPVEIQVADYDSYGALYDALGLDETSNVFRLWWD